MQSPKILIIGAGNMARPIISSALQTDGVMPENITIVCGREEGQHNETAIRRAIAEKFDSTTAEKVNITPHPNAQTYFQTIPDYTPDYVFYCAKPQMLGTITEQYRSMLASPKRTTIISIAGGLNVEQFQHAFGEQHHITRTMPTMTLGTIGIYDPHLPEEVSQLLANMGTPILLENEEEALNFYTAHLACSPAFVAQFINRTAAEQNQTREHIIASLEQIAEKSVHVRSSQPAIPTQLNKTCQTFHQNWLKKATQDFGKEKALDIVNSAITSALTHIKTHGTDLVIYANAVRSPKGITNAGLLTMGMNVPDREAYGTKEERTQQNRVATTYLQTVPVESSIVYALTATIARQTAMSKSTDALANPLAGLSNKSVDQPALALLTAKIGEGKVA